MFETVWHYNWFFLSLIQRYKRLVVSILDLLIFFSEYICKKLKNEEDQNENEKEIKRIIAKFVEKSDNKHLKDAMLFEFTKNIQTTNVNPIFLRDAIFI